MDLSSRATAVLRVFPRPVAGPSQFGPDTNVVTRGRKNGCNAVDDRLIMGEVLFYRSVASSWTTSD